MKTPIMSDSKPETIGSKVIDQTADTLDFPGTSYPDRICNAFDWVW